MNIIVQKYGGSSLSTTEKINNIAIKILERCTSGVSIAVVVSAMGDTTDNLLDIARSITQYPSKRELDMLLSTGEQVSIALLSMAIENQGGKAISMTGLQSGIVTTNDHSRAKIRQIKISRILKPLQEGKVVIIAGFQGVGKGMQITTLGRGGSDTTAAALAAELKAECCEIYTDVDGVFTADPQIVPNARKLNYISYEEMLELAGSGAQVLHPRAVEITMKYNIPLKVLSAHTPGTGTTVVEAKMIEQVAITGITSDKNVARIAIQSVPDKPGMAGRIFGAIAKTGTNVKLIVQSVGIGNTIDFSMLVSCEDVDAVVAVLNEICPKIKAYGVTCATKLAEVSIVGSGIASTPGIAAKMFKTLADEKINIEFISTSHIRIVCVVHKDKADDAVKALYRAFDL